MQMIEQLGMALGLASLAGVNLYLTVLIAGLAIRMDWLHLSGSYQQLEVLGHPWVLAVAGVFFVMQFFADKIPWVDSLWDSVHTVIRPVGGTMLGLQALGEMPPYMEVIAALAAGSAALTMHSAKAGGRLMINHSPEPVTNVSMSVAEDVGVVGGMALIILNPVVALFIFLAILVVIWLVFPRLFRLIRASLWLVWNKVRMPGHLEPVNGLVPLKVNLPLDLIGLLAAKMNVAEEDVSWTVECLSGKSKGVRGMRPNMKTIIVAPKTPGMVYFVLRGVFRDQIVSMPMAGAKLEVESRLLSDHIHVQGPTSTASLRFPRGRSALLETVKMKLENLVVSGAGEPPAASPQIEDDPALAPA